MPKFVTLSPKIRNEAVAKKFGVVKIRNEAWLENSKQECKQTMENPKLGKKGQRRSKVSQVFLSKFDFIEFLPLSLFFSEFFRIRTVCRFQRNFPTTERQRATIVFILNRSLWDTNVRLTRNLKGEI